MVDRPFTPVSGRGASSSPKGRGRPAHSEKNTRELFVMAFLRALQEAAPDATAFTAAAPAQLMDLAAAAADIALGHSVVLQLKPDLAEGQRSAVRAFLETVVRVSATLDKNRLESAISKLAEVLLPDELADARGALASDNLELRDRFIAEVPQLT